MDTMRRSPVVLLDASGSGIDTLYRYWAYGLIVLVCIGLVLLLAFWIRTLRAKSVKTKTANRSPKAVGNYYGINEIVPIDGFYSGMIVQEDGHRFTAGVRCYGFDYFSSDNDVKRSCIASYRNLILSVGEPVSLYSSYHSFDISKQIVKHEQALTGIREELASAKEDLEKFEASLSEATMEELQEHADEIEFTNVQMQARITSLQNQERHMLSMIAYLTDFVEGQEEQFQDYAYFCSYVVPFEDYNEPFATRAENALRELNIMVYNLRSRLEKIGVSSKPLSTEDLQIAVYRHSHPSGRNVSDEDILSLLGERRTIGRDGIVRVEV